VVCRAVVLGRVAVLARIATTDVPAAQALPEVDPRVPGPSSCPYSPECVEGVFSEVHLSFDTKVPKIRRLHDARPLSQGQDTNVA
jgi:hypothetical protein